MNLFSWSWVAAFAVAIGLTSTAKARVPATNGNTTCAGVIERNKGGNEDWYNVSGSDDDCSFDGHTTAGKKILAACPEGSRCRIAAYGTWARAFYIKKVRSVRRQEK